MQFKNHSPLHIMECHIQGYTKMCPFIPKHKRGKFLGLCDDFMINHLKQLDINCVQILPIANDNSTYWGYSTVSFIEHNPDYGTEKELKKMVKTLQKAGIRVVLDVVFNHTAQPIEGVKYYNWNVTGCENTVDVKNSLDVILPAMKYWLRDIGADGFRYDLAGVLGREGGNFNHKAEFFKKVKELFPDKIHIAEPYDLAEQSLGKFPNHWYELNHHARDTIRRGFPYRGTSAILEKRSIGYVTVHDGMCLRDLTEYNTKHNWANGEGNRDGVNDNMSFNHGIEGPTDIKEIKDSRDEHRFGMMKNLRDNCENWLMLAGDEMANTKYGNNNTYRHGNQISWVSWDLYDIEFPKTLKVIKQPTCYK